MARLKTRIKYARNSFSFHNHDVIQRETQMLNDLYFAKPLQDSFSYLLEENAALKKELAVYEKCYHGVLSKLRKLFQRYSKMKAKFCCH